MMFDLPKINEWQYTDAEGTILPWFVKPFLDKLLSWNITQMDLFEWGSGFSTLWFAKHCRTITSVEIDEDWFSAVNKELKRQGLTNVNYLLRKSSSASNHGKDSNLGENSLYVNAIHENSKKYDCIIIDGKHRNTCAHQCLRRIKKGGIIILDNANQASVLLNSEPTFSLFKKYRHFSFRQPNHADWRTDYWIIDDLENVVS